MKKLLQMQALLAILSLLFISPYLYAQKCETYNRKLFKTLPKDFPNQINCIDSLGKKQGSWIVYELKYNSINTSEKRAGEFYVSQYEYGKYINDRKTGLWITSINTHMLFNAEYLYYSYSGDTTFISDKSTVKNIGDSTVIIKNKTSTTQLFFSYRNNDSIYCKTSFYAKNDSSEVKFHIEQFDAKYPIEGSCSINGICIVKYRNKIIDFYPKKYLSYKYHNWFGYEEERKNIDIKLDQ